MRITNRFDLPLAPEAAFELLLDLDRVTPCLPGAELGSAREDGAREVTVTVRLGPMKFAYQGTVQITDQDPARRRAVLTGAARERRGGGSAQATIEMTVQERDGGGSAIEASAEIELTGRAAQSGRGIIEDVAASMVADMARCLSAHAAAQAVPAPETGGTAPGAEATGATGAGATPTTAPLPPRSEAVRPVRLLLRVLWRRFTRRRRTGSAA